ncbi:Sulfotransferase family protein [Thiohalospira halophila DSM 15071]|uniref:Sulfotransferase family protein n=1 Tax=Thiohalospira halophila DSM 15071 TaxID=1123397 RepID=A0A1I1WDF9_9GAMM|nr:sulfotransferase [Thiohalospira halophila]SFD93112.1 Sulfotransferase family protein [Thiohalospira halophila DSM 15071]
MSKGDMSLGKRSEEFARNHQLENLLVDLNSNLWPVEENLLGKSGGSQPYPNILIMGPHRSGSTLFMQWLANTGLVAYPTNLLSRFYRAPILGAKIQMLLTEPRFDYRNELGEFAQQAKYESVNGKTQGVLAPNEFWYFWRRFLPEPDRDVWTEPELWEGFDIDTLQRELGGLMTVFDKPFASKAMLFNYNIPFMNEILDKVIFVQIKRDEVANAQSALEARRRQCGSEEAWYSFRVPEYEALKDLGPAEQVIGHLRSINLAVDTGLEEVPEERKIVVQYEDFCEDPEKYFRQLTKKMKQQGMDGVFEYKGPRAFRPSNEREIDPRILNAI